jgi:hypothetical protein
MLGARFFGKNGVILSTTAWNKKIFFFIFSARFSCTSLGNRLYGLCFKSTLRGTDHKDKDLDEKAKR